MLRSFLIFLLLSPLAIKASARPQMMFPEELNEALEEDSGEEIVSHPTIEKEKVDQVLKWMAPNYAGQESALGYSETAFAVPKGFEERVQFWKNIYTNYTIDQGLLHDSRYMGLIYEKVDFGPIMARVDLTDQQKEKERRKYIKERKREISERLKKLEKVKDPTELEGEDKRYFEMFAKIDEPKKFSEAARKGRLRFQLGQREQFINGIYQSGRYLRQMEEIFRNEGLPIELTRLPFVESSFNLKARSRVGASGIWQFMRSTARLYMRRDSSADERNDPLRATRAAAKKMRDNYKMLNSWPLAVTGYNHGPAGVRRLTQKMQTTDIVELTDVRRGRFGFASANFYASFLAALDVERNAETHFGPLNTLPELKGVEILLTKNMQSKDFMKYFSDEAQARLYNPHFESVVWNGRQPVQRKNILRVPAGIEAQARTDIGAE